LGDSFQLRVVTGLWNWCDMCSLPTDWNVTLSNCLVIHFVEGLTICIRWKYTWSTLCGRDPLLNNDSSDVASCPGFLRCPTATKLTEKLERVSLH